MQQFTPQQALDLAMQHHREGRLAQAEEIYRRLLELQPDNADIVHLLGLLAMHAGHPAAGRELMERSIAMSPGVARYHGNLGSLLVNLREFDAAVQSFSTALQLDPACSSAFYNLGRARMLQRDWDAAIEAFRAALRQRPDFPAAALNLGTVLAGAGRLDEAIAFYREALRAHPEYVAMVTNFGNCLKEKGELDAAVEAYRRSLTLAPDDAVTWNNLAVALKDQGQIRESIAAFRRSLDLQPGRAEVRSNLILTSFFDPDCEWAALAEEHRRWNVHHAEPLRGQRRPHANDRSPERRLRLGYVSADLREHVVGRALLPVFERHDREQFEVFCYALNAPDAVTERFRARADRWCDASDLSDDALAERIREDRIDILVDLALHTSHNRLTVFARKPAPVQVSWLGYPGSSGMEAIDYRLTDRFLETPESDLGTSREQPLSLPHCWSCYKPPAGSPPVGELPALRAGCVTFGSLNNFCKINARVLESWAQILAAAENSRLSLLTKSGSHRSWTTAFLAERGIAPERVAFFDYHPPDEARAPADYLRRYERIDIALDTFPYNGMTTTFDALWMGVPVVSLVGKTGIARAGLSILSNAGLPGLAVGTRDDYVRTAVELASDLPALGALRERLRERLECSPLLSADGLARDVETALRVAWRNWCSAPAER